MNFHCVQSKFYYAFFKLLMSPPNSFVVSSLLSLKRSVFGTGLSKRMLQVWYHVALCGQPGDHAAASCDWQQLQGLKETSKTTKASLSRTQQLVGGGGGHLCPVSVPGRVTWESTVYSRSGRRHQHRELICHLSQKVTKDGGRFDQDSYEKSQEAHQGIAVSHWDKSSTARVKGLANINI